MVFLGAEYSTGSGAEHGFFQGFHERNQMAIFHVGGKMKHNQPAWEQRGMTMTLGPPAISSMTSDITDNQ